MGCATSTVKYILFIFNLLCALLGIGIIALGSVLFNLMKEAGEISPSFKVIYIPVSVIVLGCVIFIIAFFGCCGAIRESHCMTITYSVFLFLLMLLQIILVVVIFVAASGIENEIVEAVHKVWEDLGRDPKSMDFMQTSFNCCGIDGPQDYSNRGQNIPASCCLNPSMNCPGNHYTSGCKKEVTGKIMYGVKLTAYIGLGVFVTELIGFIFACCLANHIRNHKRRSTY